MNDVDQNMNYQAERDVLVQTVNQAKQGLETAKDALRQFDENLKTQGVTMETDRRRGPRRTNGVPSIEDALVIILRENGNQPMTAQQVYDALVARTEWTYKSGDLSSYVRYTLSGQKKIFDRPQVTVNGKVEKRGWYSANPNYVLRSGPVTLRVPAAPKTPTRGNADEILNTEFKLGVDNNPFKQTQETA